MTDYKKAFVDTAPFIYFIEKDENTPQYYDKVKKIFSNGYDADKDKNDMPMVALHWEKYFQHIREKYNSIYKVQMPPITPHVCRHTFCSNMAKSGMNPKMLQYIMGHSDISVTMNTYTHVKFQDAQEDFQKAINS